MSAELAQQIMHATRVESFRLEPHPDQVPSSWILGKLGDWHVTEVGPELNDEERRRFQELLLDPKHYTYREKACMFEPRHALRFFCKDGTVLGLLFCFQCSQLSLNAKEGLAWSGYFEPMGIELKKSFERLFARGREAGVR